MHLYHYALLSHAVYLNLNTTNIFLNIDRKTLFKVLTHNIFQKECVTIEQFEPLMAFDFITRDLIYLLTLMKNVLIQRVDLGQAYFKTRKIKNLF